MDVGAWQFRRQPHAARRLRFGRLGLDRLAQLADLLFEGRHVGVHRLFQ